MPSQECPQARYYDFKVRSERKRIEKLRYLHRNPVKCGLAEKPEEWEWSSFRHYAEIESHWTAMKKEQVGIVPKLKIKSTTPPQQS
jgi:putative transposase